MVKEIFDIIFSIFLGVAIGLLITMPINIQTIKILKNNQNKIIDTKFPNEYKGKFKATFYCPCVKCVGNKKIIKTATGNIPISNKTIAVDSSIIPLHSIVYIPNYGYFVAEDTGNAIKGNKIDIFVDSHEEALKQGNKNVDLYVMK